MVVTINLNPPIPSLPRVKDKRELEVRYMLIPPFASAHIYWDKKISELVYELEEPLLQDYEKEILQQIENAMLELINVNVALESTIEATTEYIDKTARLLIEELNIKIAADTYDKIFYYLFRDFVGLNEIDPLLRDYFIEDIECNGANTPIYIIHRVYRNLRTNIVYKDMDKLASFVEKLAQRAGRYVSYAQPLLDGTLPDASRVNATYTKDVTSRGPTFSIRKFTRTPWTPTQLIALGTLSPEMLAYFWILIENKANILIAGGTASGKCVVGDTPIYLSNGGRIAIKELVEERLKKGTIKMDGEWEFANGDGTEILSLNEDLKIKNAKIEKFWRHKAPQKLYNIITKSGRRIVTTPEHPFFVLKNGKLSEIRADEITKDKHVAVPRNLPIFEKEKTYFDAIDKLKDEDKIYVYGIYDEVKRLFSIITEKYKLKSEKELAEILECKDRTFYSWKNENAIPLKVYFKLIEMGGEERITQFTLKSATTGLKVKIPELSSALFRFLALVIADGHLRKNYVEFHNSNNDLLEEFKRLGEELFGIRGKIEDYVYRVKRVRLYSPVIAKLLNLAFEIPYGKKARKVTVPKILFEQDNEMIKEFVSGIFDCEGYVGKSILEIGMSSREFLEGLSILLLRLGIAPRVDKRRISISNLLNIVQFENNCKLRDKIKESKLKELANRGAYHTNVDLIPDCANLFREARLELGLNKNEFARKIGVGRRLVGMWENGDRLPSIVTFNKFADVAKTLHNPGTHIVKLAHSDIFWDKVAAVEIIDNKEEYVYDLSVNNHNFLAGNIPMIVHNTTLLNAVAFFIPPEARVVSIEDTRELNIPRENWLPAVSRTSIGIGKVGEVDLFSLLKSSFRQNPDYLIVGEVRGKEAYVLFQGMASGHSSLSTIHADSVDTLIRRLQTPPIELSPTLVNSLDCVAIATHAVAKKQETRRVREIIEVVNVNRDGTALISTPFIWSPNNDRFYFKKQSKVLEKISVRKGVPLAKLQTELIVRAKLLYELYRRKIYGFDEVGKIVNDYYKNPVEVLNKFNIQ